MSDKIRKYAIPNLPYLMFVWVFAQFGEAFRLATGANIGQKLLGMVNTINPAFGTILPTHIFDMSVGLVGAVLVRLLVWNSTKPLARWQ